jgi:hypothetical protein
MIKTARTDYGKDHLGGDYIRVQQGQNVVALTDRKLAPGLLVDAGYGHDAFVQLTLDPEHMIALRDWLDQHIGKEQQS